MTSMYPIHIDPLVFCLGLVCLSIILSGLAWLLFADKEKPGRYG